jgi:hypothetical protein
MKRPLIKGMSENLQNGMSWLAKTFAGTLHDPAQDEQDIYQDLWVVYLERKVDIDSKPLKKGYENRDDLWFTVFKNYLIDRARRAKMEPNSLKAALDENPYENTNDD